MPSTPTGVVTTTAPWSIASRTLVGDDSPNDRTKSNEINDGIENIMWTYQQIPWNWKKWHLYLSLPQMESLSSVPLFRCKSPWVLSPFLSTNTRSFALHSSTISQRCHQEFMTFHSGGHRTAIAFDLENSETSANDLWRNLENTWKLMVQIQMYWFMMASY